MRLFIVSDALLALAAPAAFGAAVHQIGNSALSPCPARNNLGNAPARV
jgi:hypothetical protein